MPSSPPLTTPDAISRVLREVTAAATRRRGIDEASECMTVVSCAGEFAGSSYRITRELVTGLIDCSTLVSQCVWIGAGAATPFVAETQRLAYNALSIPAENRLPGDVLVRYPSRAQSPDGRHNHVALFVGEDQSDRAWLIESRAPVGVRARPVDEEDAEGGIRRFLPNPTRVFPGQQEALGLARAVPKLGRLGARLTAGGFDPPRHRGVDIYFHGLPVLVSPVNGTVTYRRDASRGRS